MPGSTGAHRASPQRRVRYLFALGLAVGLLTAGGSVPALAGSVTGTATAVTTIDRPWYTTEQYYLALANCTRTGGWVLSDGTCRGYGSGAYSTYVAPFRISAYISDRDSRPYAKLLATRGLCSHYADGDPATRLRRIGMLSSTWGENIGCRDGYATAKAAVLASHLVFQSEKASNGGHWRNLKNPKYIFIAVGIWRYGSRTRLVTDFYG